MRSETNATHANAADDHSVVKPARDVPVRRESPIDGGHAGSESDDNESDERLLEEAGYGHGV